jgi:CheY-like chemotaxis protein
MMEDTKYCLCCGENVPFNQVERDNSIESTCNYCGFPLPGENQPYPAMNDTVQKPHIKKFRYVLFADDSEFIRNIIQDLLAEKKLADDILSFENGLELTSAFSKLIAEQKPVDVAILDINMPVMDGLSAARIIRAVESQNNVPSTPIAFFSSVKADENLRTQMEMLAPANYVNKGKDPDPQSIAERVEQLLSYFMQMKQ